MNENEEKTNGSAKPGSEPAAAAPPPPPVAASEAADPLKALEAQLKEKDARYVYLYAEFENYKKRMARERADLLKFGWESLARDLLSVIDNLERALAHMPAGTDKTMSDGIHMILNQFRALLEKQGVQAVTVEGPFDPNLHEAVGQEESEKPPGSVVREATRGYMLHGRLLRPAKVILSGGKSK